MKTSKKIIVCSIYLLLLTSLISAIAIDSNSVYKEGESIKGNLSVQINKSETISNESVIVFNTDNKSYEFLLDSISSKTIEYAPVKFSFRITSEKENKSDNPNGENQNVNQTANITEEKNITENKKQQKDNPQEPENQSDIIVINETNVTITTNSTTENNSSQESNLSKTEDTNKSNPAPITGNVIGRFFTGIFNFFQRLIMTGRVTANPEVIEGSVKTGEQFTYSLSEKQSIKITEGSVKTETKELPENTIQITVENNQAIITTNYSEEKTQEFNINLESLNILLDGSELKISIKDNGTELISKVIAITKPKTEEIPAILNENISLSAEEQEILLENFGNQTARLIKSEQVEDRIILRYELENYWFEPSYQSDLTDEELTKQMEEDRIRWLKDIAKMLSEKENQKVDIELESEYPI